MKSNGDDDQVPIRIVLVDDQPLIRRGFAAILESEPGFEVVGEAANGAEALDVIKASEPDVVCMDVQMPVMNGIDATRELKAVNTSASILILTTFDHDEFLFDGLQAGASGFLLKTAEAEELIAAVATLARGEALLAPEVTGRVLSRFVTSEESVERAEVEPPKELSLLTEREQEILLLLARGYSNAAISTELFIGETTVKTHVSNALTKIGVKDRVHAVIWAYENGLVNGKSD